MTEELKTVLNKADRLQRVYELLRSYGADEQQAHVGSIALADKFEWTGAQLTFNATGKNAVDDPQCKEAIAKDYAFLLPPPKAGDKPVIAQALLDKAFVTNNLTARGEVFRLAGKAEADKLARDYGLNDFADKRAGKRPEKAAPATGTNEPVEKKPGNGHDHDHATNPFSRAGWSITKQGSVLRAIGPEKVAALAASVGAKIGSTSWNKDHPANQF